MQKKKKNEELKQDKRTTDVTQDENKTNHKEKSILKPFVFFAVFVACVGGAMLYPYMMQEQSFSKSNAPVSSLKKEVFSGKIIGPTVTEGRTEASILPDDIELSNTGTEMEDCTSKDKTVLSQKRTIDELNERVHQLEIENLNLKEQTNSSEKLIPLTVQLLEEIYAGEAFGTTLKSLLLQDKTNSFALMIQEHLGTYATTGLPTTETLKKQFYTQMKMAQDTLYVAPANASWNQKSANFFKSLVHIYPVQTDPDKASAEELLFLAKQQVDSQNFKDAILTIERLPSSSKQFLAGFVQNAQHYIEARQIIKAYLNSERN